MVIFSGGAGGSAPVPPIDLWQVIETYEAAIPEATHTFTFPAIDFDDDSFLMLAVDMGVTAALNLEILFDAFVAAYFTDGSQINSSANNFTDINAATEGQLVPTGGIFSEANAQVIMLVRIGISKAGNRDWTRADISFQGGGANGSGHFGVVCQASNASLTDIIIQTSASTWQVGTRMTLYRVNRA